MSWCVSEKDFFSAKKINQSVIIKLKICTIKIADNLNILKSNSGFLFV